MRQLFQDLRDGSLHLREQPAPSAAPGRLVIQGECSLISAGTERMLLAFGRGSWLAKLRSQPGKARQALARARSDGLAATFAAVRRQLAAPMALGYSHVGRVLAVGPGVPGFRPGDRVLSNGPHAEIVSVPRNLCARVPEGLAPDEAVLAVVGAIALQGLRLLEPTLGERVAVLGLGLIGQLAVQLLLAQGCRVLAVDLDPAKVALARARGAEGCALAPGGDPAAAALAFSAGRGVDGVLIAAATAGNAPLVQAAAMCRQRGRIVLVGVVAIRAPRDLFYRKELTFQVSCSYGPGRYDAGYEESGRDYPFGLVRWTQQRNFEAVLDLMAGGRIACGPLRSIRFPFADAALAYDHLAAHAGALGILLDYPGQTPGQATPTLELPGFRAGEAPIRAPGLGLIGAGAFATGMLLPLLKGAPPVRRLAVMSRQGASAALAAERFGFQRATTRLEEILEDPAVEAVLIATRHDSHAGLVARALDAGKHVFVEKPLATDAGGLERVRAALARRPDLGLTVGFNRRFAPMVRRLRDCLEDRRGPLHLLCEINAGALPAEHWALGPEGAGRLVGEGCHFIDLMRHLTGSLIRAVDARPLGRGSGDDAFTVQLAFADGSLGTLLYTSQGHGAYPKESYSLHWEGRSARLVQFRRLEGWGVPGLSRQRAWGADKGHGELVRRWIAGLGRQDPIAREELLEVAHWTLRAKAGL